MLSSFEFGVTYAFLIKVEHDNDIYHMAGTQIGFKLEDSTHLDVINDIYDQILNRLSKLIQNYNVNYVNTI